MRYVTPCTEGRMMVPPGADHKEKYQEWIFQPGTAYKCIDPSSGEWITVEVSKEEAEKIKYAWSLGVVGTRGVCFFKGPDGTEYAQPDKDDPRAKDRELGSTKKRSRFMSALKKARAEEAARQGKTEPDAPRQPRQPRPKKERKAPVVPDLID